jgi:DNA-binding GntR family transcriptional regulator
MTSIDPLLARPDLVEKPATVGNRVFAIIRQAIVQLQLKPGDPLSEAEMTRQLGVSRQPVREAFIKLAEVGLVEIRPQRGTSVVMISLRDVENARFIREALEVAVVRRAAEEITDEHKRRLTAILDAQRSASARGDLAEFLRQDEAFHQAIAQAADCEKAWRLLENLKAQMDRVRYLSLDEATPVDVLIEQHDRIAAGIFAGDADAAESAMKAHLREILTSLPLLAEKHPDLFTA